MSNSIKTDPLSVLCRQITDGTHDSPKLQDNGVPFIKGKHISSGIIDFAHCDYITYKDHLNVIARSKPERGDTLFSNIGSVGDMAFVNTDIEFSIKNVALFKPDTTRTSPRYLYYLLKSPIVQDGLLAHRSGSAQPFIGLSTLRDFCVQYHSELGSQRRIASILSTYDDLIENNTRRIEILEEMARRIYEEWFIRFCFPGHERVCTCGQLPDGWKKVRLDSFGTVITGKTPSKKVSDYFGSDVPFLKLPDMHGQIFVFSTSEYLSIAGAESQLIKNIPPNSLCVSCIGTAGIVVITATTCQTNQQINSLIPNNPQCREFLYFALKGLKEVINQHGATGATMTNLSKGKFSTLEVTKADDRTNSMFHANVAPIFNQILNLQRKNANLRAQRDLLLPKLITGQIDVSLAEEMANEENAA